MLDQASFYQNNNKFSNKATVFPCSNVPCHSEITEDLFGT